MKIFITLVLLMVLSACNRADEKEMVVVSFETEPYAETLDVISVPKGSEVAIPNLFVEGYIVVGWRDMNTSDVINHNHVTVYEDTQLEIMVVPDYDFDNANIIAFEQDDFLMALSDEGRLFTSVEDLHGNHSGQYNSMLKYSNYVFNLEANEVIADIAISQRDAVVSTSENNVYLWTFGRSEESPFSTVRKDPVKITDDLFPSSSPKIEEVMLYEDWLVILTEESGAFVYEVLYDQHTYGIIGFDLHVSNEDFGLTSNEKITDVSAYRFGIMNKETLAFITSADRYFVLGRINLYNSENGYFTDFTDKQLPYEITHWFDFDSNETIVKLYPNLALTSTGRVLRLYETTCSFGQPGICTYEEITDFQQDFNLDINETIVDIVQSSDNFLVTTNQGRVLLLGPLLCQEHGSNSEFYTSYDITSFFNFSPGELPLELQLTHRSSQASLLTNQGSVFFWGRSPRALKLNLGLGCIPNPYNLQQD